MCAYTLSHPHHSSPHTNILASLVKGEVLSPEKIRATTGGIAAPTLSIPTTLSKPHPSLAPRHHPCLLMNTLLVSHPHYPSPHTNILASLVKGEVLSPEKIRATTGGIAAPTLPKPHYHAHFS